MTERDKTQVEEQRQVTGQFDSRAGEARLFGGRNELEVENVGPQQSELLPGFWQVLPGVITTKLQALLNWGRRSSLWFMPFGTACCGMELAAFIGSKYDFDRHGMVPWFSPRQCDLMIVAGTITEKMAPAVVQLYNQMPEPRYVLAMGGCAINGGPFYQGYNVVDGVDKLIPVDVYVPGCPPRPEALLHGIYMLRDKIARAGLPAGDGRKRKKAKKD